MSDFEPPLSPTGEDRRRRILDLAVNAARRRRLRRRVGRGSSLAVVIALIASGVWWHAQRLNVSSPSAVAGRSKLMPTPRRMVLPATRPIEDRGVTFVVTDPTILDRLRIDPATNPPRWRSIGDRELLADLAAAGKPAGMIRLKDRVVLIARR
jgi:hypothetical protein